MEEYTITTYLNRPNEKAVLLVRFENITIMNMMVYESKYVCYDLNHSI